jgi:hypothetical protein
MSHGVCGSEMCNILFALYKDLLNYLVFLDNIYFLALPPCQCINMQRMLLCNVDIWYIYLNRRCEIQNKNIFSPRIVNS